MRVLNKIDRLHSVNFDGGFSASIPMAKSQRTGKQLVSVLQPYFAPDLSWWERYAKADIVVLLDNSIFRFNSQSDKFDKTKIITHRLNLTTGFLQLGTQRYGNTPINAVPMRYGSDCNWMEDFYKKLLYSYGKAPNYSEIRSILDIVFLYDDLASCNIAVIKAIADYCGLPKPTIYRASELSTNQEPPSIERLPNLVESAVGSTNYGLYLTSYEHKNVYGLDYDLSDFQLSNWRETSYHEYYIPGMSIIDYLMYNDPQGLLNYLM